MKRSSLGILLLTGCYGGLEPYPELSGVWFDSFILNGLRTEWTLALDESDGGVVGRYRMYDLRRSAFVVDGDVNGRYGHPDVALDLTIYGERTLNCQFEGMVSPTIEVLSGFLLCLDRMGAPGYAAPMNFERLKGLDDD